MMMISSVVSDVGEVTKGGMSTLLLGKLSLSQFAPVWSLCRQNHNANQVTALTAFDLDQTVAAYTIRGRQ